MIKTHGHYTLILAKDGVFANETEAFDAFDNNDTSNMIEVIDQDNIITDGAYMQLFSDNWNRVQTNNGPPYGMSTNYYISMCSGTFNSSTDYRKTTTFDTAGLVELVAGNTSSTLNKTAKTITVIYTVPSTTSYNIDAIALRSGSGFTTYPYSIIWLSSQLVKPINISLYCKYVLNYSFIYDSNGCNKYANQRFVNALNKSQESTPQFVFNVNIGNSTGIDYNIGRHLPPVDESNVCDVSSVTLTGGLSLASLTALDFSRWRVGIPSGVDIGSTTGTTWVGGRSVSTSHILYNYTMHKENNYAALDHLLGCSPLPTKFSITPTMRHGATDTSEMINSSVNPPESVADVKFTTTTTNTETFNVHNMSITRSGDANTISKTPVLSFEVSTNIINVSVDFNNSILGNKAIIQFSTTNGTLPSGLTTLTDYYVTRINETKIKVSIADDSNYVTLNDSGSGTITIERISTAKAMLYKYASEGWGFKQLMQFKSLMGDTIPKPYKSASCAVNDFHASFMYSFLGFYRKDEYVYIIYNNSTTATPDLYLLQWRFKTIEHPVAVMRLPAYAMSGVLIGNELIVAGSTGVSTINLTTFIVTSTMTTVDGLLDNWCVFIDNVDDIIYVYHKTSITKLNTSKGVIGNLSTNDLNAANAYDFLNGIPNVIDGHIIWGDIKPYARANYDTNYSNATPAYIKIYNPITKIVYNLGIAVYNTQYHKPAAVYSYKYDNNTIRLVIYATNSLCDILGSAYGAIQITDYNMTTGTFNPITTKTIGVSGDIVIPDNNVYENFVVGTDSGLDSTGYMYVGFYVCFGSGQSNKFIQIVMNPPFTARVSATTRHTVTSQWASAININSSVHYRYSAGFSDRHRTFMIDDNKVHFNGLYISGLNQYWNTTTQKWQLTPCEVYVNPTISLPQNVTLTTSNAGGFSSTTQLIVNERFNVIYGNGIIKRNTQACNISVPYVYIGTMYKTTDTAFVVPSNAYTIPEKSNINFRVLIDDESILKLNGTVLTRGTGTNKYSININTGVITFDASLVGKTIDMTYYCIFRNS